MKAAVLAMAFGLALGAQDEFGCWVEDLSSDRIDVRDEAARRLERLGPDAIARIEAAAAQASDLEIRARLGQIVRAIRKRAEFSKVWGETKRATLNAKDRPIGEVLVELGTALGEKFVGEGLDLQKPVSLKLEGATLWETLDQVNRAADVTCEFERWGRRILVRPGAPPLLPTLYMQQFRVGVVEVKRIERRSPGGKEALFLLVLEVRHQPNMKPSGDAFTKRFELGEVKDAQGNDVARERPGWGGSMSLQHRAFALQEAVLVRGDAVGPLTISGTARIAFAREVKELTLPVDGSREFAGGGFRLKVRAFNQSPAGTTMTLEGQSTDGADVQHRVDREEFVLVDEKGKKHPGGSRGGGGSDNEWGWNLEFPAGIEKPQSLSFRWIQEYKTVEIPFRFEGIALPD